MEDANDVAVEVLLQCVRTVELAVVQLKQSFSREGFVDNGSRRSNPMTKTKAPYGETTIKMGPHAQQRMEEPQKSTDDARLPAHQTQTKAA